MLKLDHSKIKTEFIEGHCESCGMAGDVRGCKIKGKEHQLCLSCDILPATCSGEDVTAAGILTGVTYA